MTEGLIHFVTGRFKTTLFLGVLGFFLNSLGQSFVYAANEKLYTDSSGVNYRCDATGTRSCWKCVNPKAASLNECESKTSSAFAFDSKKYFEVNANYQQGKSTQVVAQSNGPAAVTTTTLSSIKSTPSTALPAKKTTPTDPRVNISGTSTQALVHSVSQDSQRNLAQRSNANCPPGLLYNSSASACRAGVTVAFRHDCGPNYNLTNNVCVSKPATAGNSGTSNNGQIVLSDLKSHPIPAVKSTPGAVATPKTQNLTSAPTTSVPQVSAPTSPTEKMYTNLKGTSYRCDENGSCKECADSKAVNLQNCTAKEGATVLYDRKDFAELNPNYKPKTDDGSTEVSGSSQNLVSAPEQGAPTGVQKDLATIGMPANFSSLSDNKKREAAEASYHKLRELSPEQQSAALAAMPADQREELLKLGRQKAQDKFNASKGIKNEPKSVDPNAKFANLSKDFLQECHSACTSGNSRGRDFGNARGYCIAELQETDFEKAQCDSACENKCQTVAQERNQNAESYMGGKYTGGQDTCGPTDLILAADKYQASGGSRKEFFDCMNGGTSARCSEIKSGASTPTCNLTQVSAQVIAGVNQASRMGMQTAAQITGQDAAAKVQMTQMKAQMNYNSSSTVPQQQVDLQKTALRSSADAAEKQAKTAWGVAGAQALMGAALTTLGIMHIKTGSNIDEARQNAQDESVSVGADGDGNAIKGNSMALIGSASKGNIRNEDDRNDAQDNGADIATKSSEAHAAIGAQTLAQGVGIMTEAGQNTAQGFMLKKYAEQQRELANMITTPPPPTNTMPGFTGWNQGGIVSPGINGISGNGEIAADASPVTADTPPTMPEGGDLPNLNPLNTNPQPGGLAAPPVSISGLNPLSPSGSSNGGSAAGGASDTGGGSGKSEGGGDSDPNYAKSGSAAKMESMNGYASSGGGRSGKNGTGMDLNGLMAQFLNKKDKEDDKKGSSILDLSKNGRGLASDNGKDDGSILGPNSNLFLRVSNATWSGLVATGPTGFKK